jgi:ABC-type transport system involved in multi-copper enzyme maturation permease subunit
MEATIEARAGRAGFGQVLHAEWTKFRTVRGWVIGMIIAPLVTVGLGQLASSGFVCSQGNRACSAPRGPGGVPVTDSFYFVHQPLAGDGSITVRVTALTAPPGGGLQPWSKAGIIVSASSRVGSAYAAMMVTPGHGVRMQYDYTRDTPGLPGPVSAASPRWLRLTRSGDTVTGYDSADGSHWRTVGAADLAGLPATVQAGLFAASPPPGPGTGGGTARRATGPTPAIATFDHVSHLGAWPSGRWAGSGIGAGTGPGPAGPGGFHRDGGTVTVTGSGDIAPAVSGGNGGTPVARTLVGAFAGLIAMAVVAAMFMTAEYRRGLIRTTLAASTHRGQVLAAKAIVVGSVSFAAGLAGGAIAVPLGERALREHGNFIAPVTMLTQVRVVAGTAALLAVAAVLALALGTVLRDSTAAVTAVVAGTVLPYLAAVALPVLPPAAADWLLRVSPAAGFAIQQTASQYPQVSAAYIPFFGYYPLPPWAGFGVLCAWTAAALGLAALLLRRRDA